MKRGLIFIALFLSVRSLQAQEPGQRVIISNIIGDTLRPAMRNHFGLLGGIEGYEWAVFYLENDSILNVKVHYLQNDRLPADTVIDDYGTLSSVHSALVKRGGVELDSASVLMKDGSLVGGTILGQTEKAVIILNPHLGVLRIPGSQVEKIARFNRVYPAGDIWPLDDPNYTRAFVMPTANTLPAGKGYVGDYELIFLTAAVGVTDWFMVNAGTLLFPLPAEDMVFDYGFKVRLSGNSSRLNAALGLEMISGPGASSGGLAYMVGSFGDQNEKLNIALGNAFLSRGRSSVAFGVSGDYRISESIKLMGELWYLPNSNWSPVVIGVRFFGSRLSGDLGLMYPVGVSLGSPIGIPVASITYGF